MGIPIPLYWTTVSGNLLQTPAAAWPGIASRCLRTYACHAVSVPRCALMLWGLMATYSLLIAKIATLRYSSESVCLVSPPFIPRLTGEPPAPKRVLSDNSAWQPEVYGAGESSPLFSMLCFTGHLPPFRPLLTLTLLFFHVAELGPGGGDSHTVADVLSIITMPLCFASPQLNLSECLTVRDAKWYRSSLGNSAANATLRLSFRYCS